MFDVEQLRFSDPALYAVLTRSESQDKQTKTSRSQRRPLNDVFRRRTAAKLTQEDLAEAAGLSRRSVVAIENGKQQPTVFTALRIAEALKTDVNELFGFGPATPTENELDKRHWVAHKK